MLLSYDSIKFSLKVNQEIHIFLLYSVVFYFTITMLLTGVVGNSLYVGQAPKLLHNAERFWLVRQKIDIK